MASYVKATPAFNLSMCQRFDVTQLEFDGRTDSILHPYDRKDRRHMEYLVDRGTYADVPVGKIIATFRDSCLEFSRQIASAAAISLVRQGPACANGFVLAADFDSSDRPDMATASPRS
jgi:hypothetical protein